MSDQVKLAEVAAPPVSAEQLADPHLRVIDDPESPIWKEAEDLIAVRFVKSGYYDSPEAVREAHAPYYDRSVMVVSQDNVPGDDGEVAAAVLLILPNNDVGQKTMDDLADPDEALTVFGPEQWDRLIDLQSNGLLVDGAAIGGRELPASASIDDKEAARFNTLRLWGAMARVTNNAGATHMLGAMDAGLFEHYYELRFAGAVERMGPAVDYAGSPSIPALLGTQEMAELPEPRVQAAVTDGYSSLEAYH